LPSREKGDWVECSAPNLSLRLNFLEDEINFWNKKNFKKIILGFNLNFSGSFSEKAKKFQLTKIFSFLILTFQ